MPASRTIADVGKTLILLIAVLIVLHLFVVHGHGEVTAVEACLVLLAPLTAALVAGLLRIGPSVVPSPPEVAKPMARSWEVRRLLPPDSGTVMLH